MLLMTVAAGCASFPDAAPDRASDLGIEWEMSRMADGRPMIRGYVHNDRVGAMATGVVLLVEGIGPLDPVLSRITAYVYGEILPHGRAYFEVAVPSAEARYRVSFRRVAWRAIGGP
jgi:hypothetical protein